MFQKLGVLEKVLYRRAKSRFFVGYFFSHIPENIVVEPLRFREKFQYQRFPRIGRGGLLRISVEDVWSHNIE